MAMVRVPPPCTLIEVMDRVVKGRSGMGGDSIAQTSLPSGPDEGGSGELILHLGKGERVGTPLRPRLGEEGLAREESFMFRGKLRDRHLRTIAQAAADLGRTELVDLVDQIQEARQAQSREKMRWLIRRIEADRIARHAEIRQLIAEFEEAHDRRRQELDELRAEVRESREEWQRALEAIEQTRRDLRQQ